MASKRRVVSWAGIIRGQGQQATCTVRAVEVTMPGTTRLVMPILALKMCPQYYRKEYTK